MFQVAEEMLNNSAILDENGTVYTYKDLEKLAKMYASNIQDRSLVMILCDYSIDTVAFYYCMMQNKQVPMLLDGNIDAMLLANIINQYMPNYIWISKKKAAQLKIVGNIIKEIGKYALLLYHEEIPDMNQNLALLLTTSGSTGSPKFVRLSRQGILHNAQAMSNALHINQEDRAVAALPMNYCYGLSVFHMHWLRGGSMFLTEKSMLESSFWNLIEVYQITNFAGVPFNYDMMQKVGFLEKEFTSLRFITEGGGKLSEESQKLFGKELKRKKINFYICYGQTEGTTYLSYLPPTKILEKYGSIGQVIEGMKVVIKDANENGEGELCFVGESVCMGYALGRKDLCLSDENQGWLKTGDIAYIDEEKYIFLRGRKKRFIKILGKRVNMDEMQGILNASFSLCNFAVKGMDDFLQIFFCGEEDTMAIKFFCESKFSIPRQMIQVKQKERLPFSASGKLLYEKLD